MTVTFLYIFILSWARTSGNKTDRTTYHNIKSQEKVQKLNTKIPLSSWRSFFTFIKTMMFYQIMSLWQIIIF